MALLTKLTIKDMQVSESAVAEKAAGKVQEKNIGFSEQLNP